MRHRGLPAVLLALAVAVPVPLAAHGTKEGGVRAGHAWAKPSAEGTTMVFVPLLNEGDSPREIVRVTSPAAARVYLENGTGEAAERLENLTLRPGTLANLARWREHIRLADLTAPLDKGDRVRVTLHFADGQRLTLTAIVESQPGH